MVMHPEVHEGIHFNVPDDDDMIDSSAAVNDDTHSNAAAPVAEASIPSLGNEVGNNIASSGSQQQNFPCELCDGFFKSRKSQLNHRRQHQRNHDFLNDEEYCALELADTSKMKQCSVCQRFVSHILTHLKTHQKC